MLAVIDNSLQLLAVAPRLNHREGARLLDPKPKRDELSGCAPWETGAVR